MKLNIKDIGIIEDATIEMNGITVLAGENDTGKSTIGKVLYSIFSSLHDCENQIDDYIRGSVNRELRNLYRYANYRYSVYKQEGKKVLNRIMECSLEDDEISIAHISHILNEEINEKSKYDIEEDVIYDCSKKIELLLKADRENVKRRLVQTCFNKEFCFQINNLYKKNSIGKISLFVKDKEIYIEICENSIREFRQEINLLYDATYLDAPMVIADLDHNFIAREKMCEHRYDVLYKFGNKNNDTSIVDEAIADERLRRVVSLMDQVVAGQVLADENKFVINVNGASEPVNVQNLSSGMKAFLILKTIILNGYIKDRSVLILDEPEIHLHPSWQILLANIIVCLQKEFEITCLINTHSPYFLNAIEVFSAKEGISGRCKYYLAEKKGISDVTFSVDKIYELLSEAFDTLDEIQGDE